jgi:acylphosphatase
MPRPRKKRNGLYRRGPMRDNPGMSDHSVRVNISGHVQGVGFRAFVELEASRRGLSGWVRNRRDGSVEAVFSGPPAMVEDMLSVCRRGPRHARIDRVVVTPAPADLMQPVGASFIVLPTA